MNQERPPDESHTEMHELAAAYALHALDRRDEREYESHLATCDECRDRVAEFQETAAALAADVEPRPVPELLERRIVRAARAERPAPHGRARWALPAAGVAAVAAAAAVGLGIWATQLSHSLDHERSARAGDARVVAILAQPGARQIPVRGGSGVLVVAPTQKAVLVADSLPAAGAGKTYEAWVVEGKSVRPAGLFKGGAGAKVVELTQPVGPKAIVGVTLEKAGGSPTPTGAMLLRASV
jgi:anti-sigma-K factor RskA